MTALLLSACSTVPMTGRKQLSLVNDNDVLTSSFQQYSDYIKTAPISKDKVKTAMVVNVGRRIASATDQYMRNNGMADRVNGFKWEFNLVADPAPNAFCMPGGKIVVYEGILPYTENETGLAVVVGHEVAHAIAKHSNERMSQQVLVSVGSEFVNMAVDKQSTLVKSLAPTVFGLGVQLGVMLPYSRAHESEADHIGLILMAMAGYDPAAAEPFWNRMSQQGGNKPPAFLSTHPSDESRAAKLREWLPSVQKYYTPVY